MKRLIEKIVFCGFVTCCRRAGAPTSRWPSFAKPTTDGVVRPPSAFGITVGSPPSSTAMHELVVPRSIPIVFAMWLCLLCCLYAGELRKSKPLYSRSLRLRRGRDARSARRRRRSRRAPSTSRRPTPSRGPEDERREPDAPERLGRDERRDDRDAAAEVGLEEAEVGEARRAARPARGRAARAASGSRRAATSADERRPASMRRRAPPSRGCRARAARGRCCRGRRRCTAAASANRSPRARRCPGRSRSAASSDAAGDDQRARRRRAAPRPARRGT